MIRESELLCFAQKVGIESLILLTGRFDLGQPLLEFDDFADLV